MIDKEKLKKYLKSMKKPQSFGELSKRLCGTSKETRLLKKYLREQLRLGVVVRTKNGHYGPAEGMGLATGYFEAHRGGYGFVIVDKSGERDIFIPGRKTNGAMDNDRVIVRMEDTRRREGSIVQVVERVSDKVFGRVDYVGNACYLKPKNKTIMFDLFIPEKDTLNAKSGDNVIAEIKDYGNSNRPPTGKITKILTVPEGPKSEIDMIAEEFHLPVRFPKAVSSEAKALPDNITSDMITERMDLRALKTVTIDGERARDFDDAISIVKEGLGYKLYVHIADVSHFVPWESALDMEARKRGTSVYFPDRVIPMFPKRLSEELCSLKPKVDRLAFTVEMCFREDGSRSSANFYPSVIRSNERMTYTAVKEILIEKNERQRKKYAALLPEFEAMEELCHKLRAVRLKRGSLDFDLPEPEIILDMQGGLQSIAGTERNFAHFIVEEFMIAANEAVSGFLESLKIPTVFRIHEAPDERKLDEIVKVLKCTISWSKNRISASDFPKIIAKASDTPFKEVINYLVLRSLKQARYSTVNESHFGLASVSYTHFTSPIRRYPDLVVHRVLREALTMGAHSGKQKEFSKKLSDIAFHCSHRERVAEEAERETINALRVWFLKDSVGEKFSGKIVGINVRGLRVRLDGHFIDGMVEVSQMFDDYYVFDDKNLTLRGKNTKKVFSIGSAVTVWIESVDMQEREILFSLKSPP
ncbi:MAG: ribonuclease R [Nitrospirae bacterium]|nr:ribonuclease R [Nitrospirota bacterium]